MLYSYRQLHCLCKKWKNKKVIEFIKDELGWQSMNDFAGLRLKTCSFLKGNNDEDKKGKGKKSGSYKKTLNQVNHLGNT